MTTLTFTICTELLPTENDITDNPQLRGAMLEATLHKIIREILADERRGVISWNTTRKPTR